MLLFCKSKFVTASLVVALGVTAHGFAGTKSSLLPASVGYELIRTDHPNNVHVLKFDRSDPSLELEMGFPFGRRNFPSRQHATTIADLHDAPPETEVLGAINASFFGSGIDIIGNLATGGHYIQTPDAGRNWPVFTRYDDGGMGIQLNPALQERRLRFSDASTTDIDILNGIRQQNTLVLYTTDWGPSTTTTADGVEVILEGVNYPSRPGKWLSGTVTAIRTGADSRNNPIPAQGAVLSARDDRATVLLNNVSVGDTVSWRFRLADQNYNNARMMVDGAGWIVRDGEPATSTWNFGAGFMGRHPRTAIAWNDSHGYLVVIDGRSTESVGMSFVEMAEFFIDELGATEAVNLDGGGSSTMVIGGEMVNSPSGGIQRALSNVIMLTRGGRAEPLGVETDTFPASGRELPWDDKFTPNHVEPFEPASPGGDGHVMVVHDPTGGFETVRIGNRWDRDYFVEAWIYTEYRPDADGTERVGIFARDRGNGAFDAPRYGNGNNYILAFDSHDGGIIAGKVLDGETTNWLETPVTLEESGWNLFRIVCDGETISYHLNDEEILSHHDTTFTHGRAGIGYHGRFSSTTLEKGTRVGGFRWGAVPLAGNAWKLH
ncbi:MAG: phosphodiester glycosidase family protein [Candidatus Sumerlaeia bacterium]|nr:phosphodiester glycosidase family protein [Candidatus Sumerlaeia bacterium]